MKLLPITGIPKLDKVLNDLFYFRHEILLKVSYVRKVSLPKLTSKLALDREIFKTIYRVKDNIWRLEEVDVYGLAWWRI